jgi:hypothetical protein
VVLMGIEVFRVVTVCLCIDGSRHFAGDMNLQTSATTYQVAQHHIQKPQILTNTPVEGTWDTFPQKQYQEFRRFHNGVVH